MQIAGIGLTRSNWVPLVKTLQNQVSHQLKDRLLFESISIEEAEIYLKEFEDTSDVLKRQKADWILFSPDAFGNPHFCIKLLDDIKNNSNKNTRFVLVLKDINHDLTSILKLQPNLELVNKMQFNIYSPKLLLKHDIRRFPRIRLDHEFQTIDYTTQSGNIVCQAVTDIPHDTLIPFEMIRGLRTENGYICPTKWLQKLLSKPKKPILPERIVGILREQKGCYLFPGIPLNSIQSLNFDRLKVEHLIRLDECTIKNPPFKRFIVDINNEYKEWTKRIQQNRKINSIAIRGSSEYSVVNSFIEKILLDMGKTNIKFRTKDSKDLHIPEEAFYWLKLAESNKIYSQSFIVDWCADLDLILEPLKNFINLKNLQVENKFYSDPIDKEEFKKNCNDLLDDEKSIKKKIQYAKRIQTLYKQESVVFVKIKAFSKLLHKALSESITWEDASENPNRLNTSRVLLLCEEEIVAAEINHKLNNVKRKLWVNPFKFKSPEDLAQFNKKIILPYLKSKSIIVTFEGKRHLKDLCQKTIDLAKDAENNLNDQNKKIEYIKIDAKDLIKKKEGLALRWINVSLKQLLYRDRHLFHHFPEKR